MPRVNASLGDVQVFKKIRRPGEYRLKVVEVAYDRSKDQHRIISEVVHGESQGARIFDFLSMKTQAGEDNKYALSRLRSYVQAMLPDRATARDFDTDELVGQEYIGSVGLRESKPKPTEDNPNPASKTFPELEDIIPVR